MFTAVLVEEVISDLSLYTQEKMREIIPVISNKRQFCDEPLVGDSKDTPQSLEVPILETNKYYLRAPRNSIIGRPKQACRDSKATESETMTVYYPFFSSHLALPVKPGEVVWTFAAGDEHYWITRVHSPVHVEDSNFSHFDRENASPLINTPVLTPEGANPAGAIERVPNFPDGNSFDTRDTDKRDQTEDDVKAQKPPKRTFQREDDVPGNTHYETIYLNNNEAASIVYEPVPVLTRRPGDLVLQGSNNTSIVLGIDRGYDKDTRPDGLATNAADLPLQKNRAGTIDIVAGRGRFLEAGLDFESLNDAPSATGTTQPRIIKNIREDFERDKNLGLDTGHAPDGGHLVNVSEGDPDFLHDASRVYVSMKTSPDKMLGHAAAGSLPKTVSASDGSNAGAEVAAVENAGSVILKSDEVRIVARQEVGTGTPAEPAVNGSIKIVKEGVAESRDGNGRAAIMIQPDGTIIIDGPKIVIGSGAKAAEDNNGGGSQIALGLAAEEPMVLGTQLLGILTAIVNALDNHIHPTPAGPSQPRSDATVFPDGGFDGTADADIANLELMLSKIGKTL